MNELSKAQEELIVTLYHSGGWLRLDSWPLVNLETDTPAQVFSDVWNVAALTFKELAEFKEEDETIWIRSTDKGDKYVQENLI